MRSVYLISAMAICLGILLAACAGEKQDPAIRYRDLSDPVVRQDLDTMLSSAGVSDRSRMLFMEQLTDFIDPNGQPTNWSSRITAYSLLEDNFLETGQSEITGPVPGRELQVLTEESVGIRNMEGYQRFFEPLPVRQEDRGEALEELWLDSWENRGIRIYESPRLRLLSLVTKTKDEQGCLLQLQNAGLLFPDTDQGLQLLCKKDFNSPYELICGESREQLAVFLLAGCDPENTVLLENDRPFVCP